VELLGRLAKEIATLQGSDLHRRIEAAYFRDSDRFSEIVSEELRDVGFHSWPESGDLLDRSSSRADDDCGFASMG
jgi:hypothetical protein